MSKILLVSTALVDELLFTISPFAAECNFDGISCETQIKEGMPNWEQQWPLAHLFALFFLLLLVEISSRRIPNL